MNHEREAYRGTGKLEGRYANHFKVGHNVFEFVLDFGQSYPESEEAQLRTRIITSPNCAKALLQTLRESLDQYEQTFGTLPDECEEKTRQGRTRRDPVSA